MKKIVPHLSISFICLLTIILWVASKNNLDILTDQTLRGLSQIIALLGIVLMSTSLLLSTRFRLIENFLGGLDKAYFTHHFIGSIAFVFLINHPLMLAVQSLPRTKSSLLYLIPGTDLAYNLGILGLYFLVFSFIFIVFLQLPYHLWKITHRFLGLSFLFGSIHSLLISSDISSFLPLRLWIGFFIVIGLASSIYIIFLYRHLGPKYLYRIDKIERILDIINFYLKPVTHRTLSFIPGQFVYPEFDNRQVGPETHPFSISSAPHEDFIRLSIKILGDHTLKFPGLSEGDKLFLYGPYGKFFSLHEKPTKNVLWIAGGIGVTPFLSSLRSEAFASSKKAITFYYCYRNSNEGVFTEEITKLVNTSSNINFINWCSAEKKRLTVAEISQQVNLKSLDMVYLCGPVPMMSDLTNQLINLGVPQDKIYFENFSFLE